MLGRGGDPPVFTTEADHSREGLCLHLTQNGPINKLLAQRDTQFDGGAHRDQNMINLVLSSVCEQRERPVVWI